MHAQLQPNYYIKNKKDGLQSNQIYSIHAAKNGLLYIAHSKGISSFDGNAFTNYINRTLPFTEMSNIMETDNGDIFCKAFNNNLFKIDGDSIIQIRFIPNKFGFIPSAAFKNTIISSGNDSLYLYDAVSHRFNVYEKRAISQFQEGEKIIFSCHSSNRDTTYLLGLNEKFQQIIVKNPFEKFGNIHLTDHHLFGVENKLPNTIYDFNKNNLLHLDIKETNQVVNYIKMTDDQLIWVCTTNGLYYFDKKKGPQSCQYILRGYNISSIVRTKENSFVVSTLGDGLIFIPNFNISKLPNIPSQITNINGYSNQLILVTKNGQIFNYNLQNLSIQHKILDLLNKQKSLMFYDSIHHVYFTSSSITTLDGTIVQATLPCTIKDYSYYHDMILLATNVGMFLYGKPTKPLWLLKYRDTTFKSTPNFIRLNLFDDYVASAKYNVKDDNIYVNTYSGIFEMAKGFEKPLKLGDPNIVLSDMCVWDGELLLATKDQGILKWKGRKYEQAFENSPKGIFLKFEVFKNELWIQAEGALYKYDQNKFTKFDARYGDLFERMTNFYITDSFVFINTIDDIIRFPKSLHHEKDIAPSFLLNSIHSVAQQKNIPEESILNYDDNSLAIKFSLISFALSNSTHLAYSINQQTPIQLPNSTRDINLNNLSPDQYTIRFYIVIDNIINANPCYVFKFTIKPPFYKTWWFLTLMMALIAALISLAFKRTLDRWKKETLLKESKLLLEKELDKSMMSSIKAQMNPHFLFNALNTIQSFIYSNDKQNAGIYISKFSDLTRSILEMSTKETISLDEEIKSLKLYLELEKMRFEDSFDYAINIDSNINKEMVKIPSMLVQPYVENAIKHGLLHKKTNRELKIQFSQENKILTVSIDDNGIGRTKSNELNKIKNQTHTSFAMNANKKRLEILKNNFTNISFEIIDKYGSLGETLGTKVIIKLPL